MNTLKLALASAILTAAAAGSAQAALTPVSSFGGGYGLVTFPTMGVQPAGPVSVDVGNRIVTFSDPGATFDVEAAAGLSSFPTGTQVIYDGGFTGTTGTGTVTVAFNAPITGFSLGAEDFDTFTAPITYTLDAFDSSGALIGSQTASGFFDETLATFTDTSTTPIARLAISDNDPSTGGIGLGGIEIQPVSAPVPEPAALALLATGLLGLAAMRHRA